MYKYFLSAACCWFIALAVFSQPTELQTILQSIQTNNLELQAYQKYLKTKQLELDALNNLTDPQADFFYMPFGEHDTPTYLEFQITQTIEFPTVYTSRKELIAKQKEFLEIEYNIKRQEILLQCKLLFYQAIKLNKQFTVQNNRVAIAKKVQNQIQQLFDNEKIGIVELNKSKIVLLQMEVQISKIRSEIVTVNKKLTSFNDGQEIVVNSSEYQEQLISHSMETITAERQEVDPNFLLLSKSEDIAKQQLHLTKNTRLPNLSIGYNYQGVPESNYSGFYGGMTIPIWSNRFKSKIADASIEYATFQTGAVQKSKLSALTRQITDFENIQKNYNSYKSAFEGINNVDLLFKSYELGKLSFIEYHLELQFYYEAEDMMLDLENQLYQLDAEILQYKL